MRTLLAAIALVLAAGPGDARAQTDAVPSPLLLTTMPPPANARIVTSVDLGYNERAFEPVAGERLEPQASVLVPLSSVVAVLAQLGVASTPDGRTRVAQQGELLITRCAVGRLRSRAGWEHAMSTAAPRWPRLGSWVPEPRSDRPWPRAFFWSIPMPPAGMRWI